MTNATGRPVEKGGNPIRIVLIALVATTVLLAVACGSDSGEVASLEGADGTADANATEDAADTILDDGAAVMAFMQCMRDQGIEYEGNVQRPELVEGFTLTREEYWAAYEVCGELLEGMTLGRERPDVSEVVDRFVALAECLRDKGFEVDEPTAETLDAWRVEFRTQFDWDDPAAQAAYEGCSNEVGGGAWSR